MPKTKISEYSATANSNTDVASINIDEGCAPSGINNAIRAVMGHLKDFQSGTNGDPFNGPVNGTVGATTPSTGAFTTLSASSTTTLSGGTANGVAYLNGSKVVTTGSALVFDGTNLGIGTNSTLGVADKLAVVGGNIAVQRTSGITTLLGDSTQNGYVGTASNHAFAFLVNSTEQMRLTSTGLGVGSTSPNIGGLTRALTINTPTGGNYSGVELAGAGTLSARFITNNASGTFIGSQLSIPLVFETNATERMRIDSSGNLLVGTTGSSPLNTGKVRVYNNSAQDVFKAYQAATPYTCYWGRIDDTGSYFAYWDYLGTPVGNINTNGTSTAYNTTSDYRLKENIAPMTGALEKVTQLKPVTYKWKSNGSDGEGFIAHELAEVVPQCVTGEKDAVDAEGNPKYQGIDTSFLVATLTAALQELKAIVGVQASEIASLKSRLDAANL